MNEQRIFPYEARIQGQRMPAWLWRELHAITRAVGPEQFPVLLVNERAGRELVVLDRSDWEAFKFAARESPNGA